MLNRFSKNILCLFLTLQALSCQSLNANDKGYGAEIRDMPFQDLCVLGLKGGVIAAIAIGVKYVIVEGVSFGVQKATGTESPEEIAAKQEREDRAFKLEISLNASDESIARNEKQRKLWCSDGTLSQAKCQQLLAQHAALIEQNNKLRQATNAIRLKDKPAGLTITMKDLADKA